MIDTFEINGIVYHLPENTDDVIHLVDDARKNKEIICVRGAAHSYPIIEHIEKSAADGRPYRFVLLSKMNKMSIDPSTGIATVEAGAHLGWDPYDATGISHERNSFLYFIDKAGYGLSDLGGITHQTIGGFMSTGSSGGSTNYSFDEPLLSISVVQFVHGKEGAQLVTYNRPADSDPNDPFFGHAISIGLMGVIVSISLQCDPKFYITGSETISYTSDSLQIDPFSEGKKGLPDMETFLKQTEFTRIMWWPQAGVDKLVVWKAQKADEETAIKYAAAAYKKNGVTSHPDLKEYQEIPFIFGSAAPATLAGDFIFSVMGRWPDILKNIFVNDIIKNAIDIIARATFMPIILPKILEIFVPIDDIKIGPQEFADIGWKGLPMDNRMSDMLFPVKFTELWIPIDKSTEVMKALRDFYQKGLEETGTFSCEIYAAKSNDCWLSPAYGTDVIRIDIFWFGNNKGTPEAFYDQFWKLLAPFGFRPHWGKYLPDGKGPLGSKYLKNAYPKWSQWMQLRDKVDPDQIFVNDYWRHHLGIPLNSFIQ